MITRLDTFGRPIYEAGDIIAVANYNFLGRANQFLFMPRTFFYHYGLIDKYIESEDDYSIIESVNKGPTMGRLSWYTKKDYRIYRVNQDAKVFKSIIEDWNHTFTNPIGEIAVDKASKFGRHGYDFLLFVKLFLGILVHQGGRLIRFQKPERMTPDEIPYGRDKALCCTELVFEAWNTVGIRLRASGHAPLPAEFELAIMRNELIGIDSHWGKKGKPWRPHRLYTLSRPQVASLETPPRPYMDRARSDVTLHEPTTGEVEELAAFGTTAPSEADDMPTFAKATAELEKERPGRDIIARQGGQKRNRVHLYEQPFGYPVRLCDWVAEGEIEKMFTCATREETKATIATLIEAGEVSVCKHCQAIVEGKRQPPIYDSQVPKGGGGGGVA